MPGKQKIRAISRMHSLGQMQELFKEKLVKFVSIQKVVDNFYTQSFVLYSYDRFSICVLKKNFFYIDPNSEINSCRMSSEKFVI